jgi:hypothetical protein
MKYFITILTCFLFLSATPVMSAESGIFFDPTRDGEGATIFVDDSQFVLFFYTYRDSVYDIPPTVGPPMPPVEVCCENQPTWFIAQGNDFDGDSGTGVVYMGQGVDYPVGAGSLVGETSPIGTFEVVRNGDGFDFVVTWELNELLPQYATVYRTAYSFTDTLLSISD